MSRTKGSKNRPKFAQMISDTFGNPIPIVDISRYQEQKQFIEDEVTTMMKDMHHIVQKVNVETLPKAEEYLRVWFDKGYELTQVIFLGIEDAGATYALMYILVKRE